MFGTGATNSMSSADGTYPRPTVSNHGRSTDCVRGLLPAVKTRLYSSHTRRLLDDEVSTSYMRRMRGGRHRCVRFHWAWPVVPRAVQQCLDSSPTRRRYFTQVGSRMAIKMAPKPGCHCVGVVAARALRRWKAFPDVGNMTPSRVSATHAARVHSRVPATWSADQIDATRRSTRNTG